ETGWCKYIDKAYDTNNRAILGKIGGQTLHPEKVYSIIRRQSFLFSQKTCGWMAFLFEYLHNNLTNEFTNIVKYPLYLQLSNSTWTSVSNSETIFLPPTSADGIGPEGLDIAVLHTNFHQEISKSIRANLFLKETLKLRELGKEDIVRA